MRSTYLCLMMLFASAERGEACFFADDLQFDEVHGFPSLEAILAGKFEQHSTFYLDETIKIQLSRRKTRIVAGQPNWMTNDDLLSATFCRRGDYDGAIAAIEKSPNIQDRESTHEASLSTAYLAKGDIESAIQHLNRAIELNPREPFFREHHELMLAEYLKSIRDDPTLAERDPTYVRAMLRLAAGDEHLDEAALFAEPRRYPNQSIERAITATTAMIRYGNPAAPQLYAALGDLLQFRGELGMAYRAYRRALEQNHPSPTFLRRQLAAIKLRIPNGDTIDQEIDDERTIAGRWVEKFQAFEDKLISSDKDMADVANYAPFYDANGTGRSSPNDARKRAVQFVRQYWLMISIGVAFLFALFAKAALFLRRPPPAAARS